MIQLTEPPVVDLRAIHSDDQDVETLRLGRKPAAPGQLLSMLASWRDTCRTPRPHRS